MAKAEAKGANKYARTLEAFADLTGLRTSIVMRKLAFDGLDGVFRRSPVDTGRFRASWRVSLDSADLSVEPPSESKASQPKGSPLSGPALQQLNAINFGKGKRDQTIVISNNLPYAQQLEDGRSAQAPDGVLKPTFVELEARLNAAIASSKQGARDA